MAVAKSCWERDISLEQSNDATEGRFGREPPLVAVFGIAMCSALPVMYRYCEASIQNSNKKYGRPVPVKCISIILFVKCNKMMVLVQHIPIKKL